eukprot:CAMPEP_0119349878 /NCGR_PEP_ID=MMETSP1333-20130426/109773_1 /TAXON_ID=418940 /ORGANISM="Scyphosphaera apsteinii, Strain RCC1455" /LENGTH=57 /DNA_ID=CAMNT_0007362481 /DNA_START=727 /DNA_END=900 /DNA_ORIENTATION=+
MTAPVAPHATATKILPRNKNPEPTSLRAAAPAMLLVSVLNAEAAEKQKGRPEIMSSA